MRASPWEGWGGRVEVRRTTGIEALATLARERSPESLDFIFIDAVKTEYPEYFRLARPLIAPGGVIAFDNALGSNEWWIDAPAGSNASRDALDRLNRMVAADAGAHQHVLHERIRPHRRVAPSLRAGKLTPMTTPPGNLGGGPGAQDEQGAAGAAPRR